MVARSWRTYISTKRKEDTRYFCRGRKVISPLQTSITCVTSLRQLHSRLKKNKELLRDYDNVIKDQVKSGIIKAVPENNDNQAQTHFLPHHGVIRTDRETTKKRVVFDWSAKSDKSTASINECLEKGPNLSPHHWYCDQVSRLSNCCSSWHQESFPLDTDQPQW